MVRARATLPSEARSRSPTRTVPPVGLSMPAIAFRSVDLPAPLGPISATEPVGPSDSDRFSINVAPLRFTSSLSTAMAVMSAACGPAAG